MSDIDPGELVQLRESLREHWMTLSALEKNPLDGLTWSPAIERFDSLLRSLATGAGLEAPALPWTSRQRLDVDEWCRSAGVLNGLPLIPS